MASRPSTIIKYPGSKAQHSARILRECAPPTDPTILVDAMCGSCAWGLAAHAVYPKARLWLNDTNADLVRVLVAIRDHPERLARQLELTPYSRWLWERIRGQGRGVRGQRTADLADVVDWLMVNRQSVGGATAHTGTGWSRDLLGKKVTQWGRLPNLLRAMARELCQNVVIECLDFEALLFGGRGQHFGLDSLTTWVYCDPPYVGETRNMRGSAYRHEAMDVEFHAALVNALLSAPGAVLVSGYAHEVYDPLIDAGWERIDWQTSCHAAARTRATGIQGAGSATAKQPRVETVWLNPVLQDRLGRQKSLLLEAEA